MAEEVTVPKITIKFHKVVGHYVLGHYNEDGVLVDEEIGDQEVPIFTAEQFEQLLEAVGKHVDERNNGSANDAPTVT